MTPPSESRTFELGLVYATSEMNQISIIVSERSSVIIQNYLFIFIPQALNALNKQFNLGWKLMNYDFKGDLQTQSINRMIKIPRTARSYSAWIPKCSLTHLQSYRWKQGQDLCSKRNKNLVSFKNCSSFLISWSSHVVMKSLEVISQLGYSHQEALNSWLE